MTLMDIHSSESTQAYAVVGQFLAREALLLDDNQLWEWFDLLAEDLDYEIPIRETKKRGEGSEFIDGAYHMKDTKSSMRHRIDRLFSGKAWAEDPASRTTRVVGSTLVTGERAPGEITASSNIIVYRERALQPRHEWIAGRRDDVIRISEGGAQLVHRRVKLAHTILNTSNLGIFL